MLRRRRYISEESLGPLLDEAMKFKKSSIEITQYGGMKKRVQGYVNGLWGIHKVGGHWNLTHMPSGLAAFGGPSLAVMKAAAEQLLREVPQLAKAEDPEEVVKYGQTIKRIAVQARDNPQALAPKSRAKPRKTTSDYATEFEEILRSEGLQNLGTRYGKAGTMWGIKGLARQIAIGRRDIMANSYYVQFSYGDRKPDTRWTMTKGEYMSKMTPERLKEWIAWVKAAKTTKEVIADARREYWDKEDSGADHVMGSAIG